MSNCPICSNVILRHIHHNQIYWYCSCCHQEVPNFTSIEISKLFKQQHGLTILDNPVNYLQAS